MAVPPDPSATVVPAPRGRHRGHPATALACVGLLCLGTGALLGRLWADGTGRVWTGDEHGAPPVRRPLASLADAVEAAAPGVAAVRATVALDDAAVAGRELVADASQGGPRADLRPAGTWSPGVRHGSGFVVHATGLVVTARHLAVGALRLIVELPRHGTFDAELVGEDEITDLAVLRLVNPPEGLVALGLGRSEDLRAGDWIVAVGNPFGFRQTVTAGVVSFVGRHLPHYDLRVTNDFLQFSAQVNPGSSGSPVLDGAGRVVGVTTQAAEAAQGISFAIPSRTLKWVLDAMDQSPDGRVHRGYLGIEFDSRIGTDGRGEPLPGARVLNVAPGEPAHRAGLRRGDVVLAVDGVPVVDAGDLHDRITRSRPGRCVALTLLRDGATLAPVEVELRDATQPPEHERPEQDVPH